MMVVMQDLWLLAGKMRADSEDDRIRPAFWLVKLDLFSLSLSSRKGMRAFTRRPCNWRLAVRDRSPSGGKQR